MKIVLSNEDFEKLVNGKVVKKESVEIILSNVALINANQLKLKITWKSFGYLVEIIIIQVVEWKIFIGEYNSKERRRYFTTNYGFPIYSDKPVKWNGGNYSESLSEENVNSLKKILNIIKENL